MFKIIPLVIALGVPSITNLSTIQTVKYDTPVSPTQYSQSTTQVKVGTTIEKFGSNTFNKEKPFQDNRELYLHDWNIVNNKILLDSPELKTYNDAYKRKGFVSYIPKELNQPYNPMYKVNKKTNTEINNVVIPMTDKNLISNFGKDGKTMGEILDNTNLSGAKPLIEITGQIELTTNINNDEIEFGYSGIDYMYPNDSIVLRCNRNNFSQKDWDYLTKLKPISDLRVVARYNSFESNEFENKFDVVYLLPNVK